MKIGSANVASFRLGEATPSKVYVGDTSVWTSGPPPTVPEAIASVEAYTSITSESAIDVSWPTPADGGSAITGYNIYLSTDGGTTYSLHANVASSPYEYIEPYRGGESRSFDVRAVNAVGEAATASMYGSASLSDSPPSAPQNLTVVNAPGYDLLIEWEAPAHNGGQSETDYEIGYAQPPSSETTFMTANTTPEWTLDFTNMQLGFSYDIRVRAVNSIGSGEWTSVVSSPPVADVPSVSGSFGASTSSSNQGAITLSILVPDSNGSAITSYDVEVDLNGSFSTPISLTNYTDQPSGGGYFNKEITGLSGGVAHYFRVRFVNAAGNGDWTSYSVSAVASSTPPAQVTGFSVTPDYSGAASSTYEWDFAWTPPSDGGTSLTEYQIEEAAFEDNFSGATVVYPNAVNSTYTATAVDRDQTRYFRIRAVNSIGNGPWSTVQSSYYNTPTVPDPPEITNAEYNSGGGATYVSYTPPADDGNSTITGYTFYFDGTPVTPDATGANDATFYFDWSGTDLTMTATNAIGESGESTPFPVGYS